MAAKQNVDNTTDISEEKIGIDQLCSINGYNSITKYVIQKKCNGVELTLPNWVAKLKELKIINE